MPRHSFIRMSKLTDVQGRVNYISNPERQEHLYAAYSTVEPEFWRYLSEQSRYDFWRSNQPSGKCIEGRELIIALPESLQQCEPELVLKLFTEKFREEYGVQCSAALHHNKRKTNYHIHLVFADRDVLPKTEVKYATRNMFFDEENRHVRTKKEILAVDGNLRPGCRIFPKGEPYEMRWFTGRKEIFKTRKFLQDVKVMCTDLINQCVVREEDRQSVFDSVGPYLPTKKIGKNNPIAEQIEADNALRQEWNRTVDQVLIAGGTHEDVVEFKADEVVAKVAQSVKEHGQEPGFFASILMRAIAVLKEFLEILMHRDEGEIELTDPDETVPEEPAVKPEKGPRPNSLREEAAIMELEPMHQDLNRCNRKLYALQKKLEPLQLVLSQTPKDIFHRKERKNLQENIAGLQRQIDQTRTQLETIPRMHGFDSVVSAEKAYRSAKAALDTVRRKQAEWDGVPTPKTEAIKPKNKTSVLKQLAAKQLEVQEREHGSRSQDRGRNGGKHGRDV